MILSMHAVARQQLDFRLQLTTSNVLRFEDFLHKLLTMDVIPCDEDMFDICRSLFIGVACAGIRKYIIFY